MIKFLIHRPISVMMAFIALFIIGIVTYLNLPVSLLPDIDIPEITVQVSGSNASAREIENTVVTPLRQQLLQVNKLRDIRSETRDGNSIIRMSFEYGTSTDLAFIEVNEKIDAAMNYLPKESDRPRVIKASATDIPVFNLYLTLKEDQAFKPTDRNSFLDLSEFAETVIRRRIEQLPEVAMVDVSGAIRKEVLIVPDHHLMASAGITYSDLENILKENNIEPGSMVVRDGHYEYNIKFSSILRTTEDIGNIYFQKNGRVFRLKNIARVGLAAEKEEGMVYYNGKRALCLAVIKQSEEKMSTMQQSLTTQIDHFHQLHPGIDFSVSQNQTELLDYTISNLQQNLLLAFLFISLVSFFFMKDIRSPLIIGINVFVSLVICLLFFYLFRVSLNVVSLTGLILALGMMIDNSIIVTDNISQYRKLGLSISDSCVKGTNEVVAPILSSTLTTVSVFIPLIFLSGIAGAVFFDQAFSVTAGQFVSYFTGIILLPVSYLLIHKIGQKRKKESIMTKIPMDVPGEEKKEHFSERIYHQGVNWVFRHKTLTTIFILAVFPVGYWLFTVIPKEKMPDISQNECMVRVEWNENIHVEENAVRLNRFVQALENKVTESAAQIGHQQFLLNREREQTASESEIYLKTESKKGIPALEKYVIDYFSDKYPNSIVSFSPVRTIFERIFETGSPDLTVEYYAKNKNQEPEAASIIDLEKNLREQTGEIPSGISFQKQLNLTIDQEKLLLYKVPYELVYQALRTGFKGNEVSVLRSYQQYLPIILGGEEKSIQELLESTLVRTDVDDSGRSNQLPLSYFVTVTPAEDLKTIVSGKNGEYIPLNFREVKGNPEKIMDQVRRDTFQRDLWDIDFSGSFFTNKKMIGELMVILFISVLLMYFILTAQFESFKQPLIVLAEIPIDLAASLGLLLLLGHSLNLMSAIGLVVSCGIIINDSILKVDMINQLRKDGVPLMEAIHTAGKRRLKAILMTSLTSIVCMAPLLFSSDMGSELEKPLAIATIGGMVVGTPVSLFIVPLIYWWLNKGEEQKIKN